MAELIWDGKYDPDGKKTAPLRVALPFQTVETVNESAQQRQKSLFAPPTAQTEWRNRLIWGDKRYVLPSLLPEFAGKVDLIYIDPPFNVGADFSFQAQVGDERFTKEASIIEQKAYRDTWGRGLDGYLAWFHETVALLHELLAETGSLYVHLDWHIGHYAKTILDEVFGLDRLQNEIVWKRSSARSDSSTYNHIHDVIFFYTKGDKYTWNQPFQDYDEAYVESKYRHDDGDGRLYQLTDITSPNPRPNMTYEWKGHKPPRNGWRYSVETMTRLDKEGYIWYPDSKSKRPRFKRYLDEQPGLPVQSVWTDINPVNSQASERIGYDTQKPETLLERILKASSNPDDFVLDCFCGSGTTAAVAEKLGRRWITADLGRFAIHTARKRLLAIENVRPFVVQNLGKYERQVWQQHAFGEQAEATVAAYRRFLLDLYDAEPVTGYAWLHGTKRGRMVHVGSVDSPVTPGDVQQIAFEFRKAIGTGAGAPKVAGVDVLGWDFALDMNETTRQIAQEASLDVRFVRIPREVLEEKAVAAGDIQFFELAALGVDVKVDGKKVTVKLTDFMVPPDDVPDAVMKAVKHWAEWIDYWAIDFNFRDDTFHNEWQSYRTRKDRKLALQHSHIYEQPGRYQIVVKAIDILGNDTTKVVEAEVG